MPAEKLEEIGQNSDAVEAIHQTLKAVLWSLLQAYGAEFNSLDITELEFKTVHNKVEGAGAEPDTEEIYWQENLGKEFKKIS